MVLSLDSIITFSLNKVSTVRDELLLKHPCGQSAHPETLLHPPEPTVEPHSVLFEQLDGVMVRSVVLRTE